MLATHRSSILVLVGGLLAAGLLASLAHAQQAPGGSRRPGPGFHLIPPFALAKLDLSNDQQKQIADLEKETKIKLGKILSADQMKTLSEARPPRPGAGGRQGGPEGGNQGGPGGVGSQPGAGPS